MILPDTEAFLSNTNVALTPNPSPPGSGAGGEGAGDSSVTANEESQIVSLAGSAALGGTGGYGFSIAFNMIGSPAFGRAPASNPVMVPDEPNLPTANGITEAYVTNSTVTVSNGTLSVTADNADSSSSPRIIVIVGSLGLGTGKNSNGFAGMIAVNLLQMDTEAYIGSSTIDASGLTVNASDISGIVEIGGAVGVGQSKAFGAGLGYNQITDAVTAYLDDAQATVTGGAVSVTASSMQTIGGVVVGVAAGTGSGWRGRVRSRPTSSATRSTPTFPTAPR